MKSTGYEKIIEEITDGIYQAYPELMDKYGEQGRRKCKEDNLHHFKQLESTYELDNAQVFIDYSLWLNGILTRHGMAANHLIDNFKRIKQAIKGSLSEEKEQKFSFYLEKGIEVLEEA